MVCHVEDLINITVGSELKLLMNYNTGIYGVLTTKILDFLPGPPTVVLPAGAYSQYLCTILSVSEFFCK